VQVMCPCDITSLSAEGLRCSRVYDNVVLAGTTAFYSVKHAGAE
jgi:hypothetical protein